MKWFFFHYVTFSRLWERGLVFKPSQSKKFSIFPFQIAQNYFFSSNYNWFFPKLNAKIAFHFHQSQFDFPGIFSIPKDSIFIKVIWFSGNIFNSKSFHFAISDWFKAIKFALNCQLKPNLLRFARFVKLLDLPDLKVLAIFPI